MASPSPWVFWNCHAASFPVAARFFCAKACSSCQVKARLPRAVLGGLGVPLGRVSVGLPGRSAWFTACSRSMDPLDPREAPPTLPALVPR